MYARTALVVPALIAAISLVAPGTAPAQQSQFAGSWILNPEESDDAQEKMQQAQRRSSEGGPMRRDRTSLDFRLSSSRIAGSFNLDVLPLTKHLRLRSFLVISSNDPSERRAFSIT